jgi:hypothetical protein
MSNDDNLIHFEKDDGTPPPDEGQLGFVIQIGPRLYGDATGMFENDDDGFAWAADHFPGKDFNIRPVLPTVSLR